MATRLAVAAEARIAPLGAGPRRDHSSHASAGDRAAATRGRTPPSRHRRERTRAGPRVPDRGECRRQGRRCPGGNRWDRRWPGGTLRRAIHPSAPDRRELRARAWGRRVSKRLQFLLLSQSHRDGPRGGPHRGGDGRGPVTCRALLSRSASSCERQFESGAASDATLLVPSPVTPRLLAPTLINGQIAALRDLGLASHPIEVVSALAALERDPALFVRWLSGEDVFARA